MQRTTLVLGLMLLLTACGGQTDSSARAGGVELGETLAQLKALPTPPGMGDAQFQELKESLASALRASGKTRFAATVPGTESAVDDLALTFVDSNIRLNWTYANRGDYDQNKQVTISDLTPLGSNLYKTPASPDWLNKSRAADGDGNSEVNIADITPLGANLFNTVEGYKIEATATPQESASWIAVGEASFEQSTLVAGNALRVFSRPLSEPVAGHWYRVVPFEGSQFGAPSNAVQFSLAAPEIVSVMPTTGEAATAAIFTAVLAGGTPKTISWDFDGGANPGSSTQLSPSVILGAAGVYDASLTVSNPAGSDTFDFTLTVINPELPEVSGVTPLNGVQGRQVNFVASITEATINDYSWSFDGGADPNSSSEVSPLVTLGAPGIYDASVTVSNAAGSDTFDFQLVLDWNKPPVVIFAQSDFYGDPGDVVQVDASASHDTDGTIVKWEWDIGGEGDFDYVTEDGLTSIAQPADPPGETRLGLRITDDMGAHSYDAVHLFSYNLGPVADLNLPPELLAAPGNVVNIDAASSYDRDGWLIQWEWDLDGNGSFEVDSTPGTTAQAVFPPAPGLKVVQLRVTDNEGKADIKTVTLLSSAWTTLILNEPLQDGLIGKPHLGVISGRPTIVYGQLGTTRIRRANDSLGVDWPEQAIPINAEEFADRLFEHNGHPVTGVINRFTSSNEIRYSRATDALGFEWDQPTIILSNAYFPSPTAFVNGLPAFVYYSGGENNVSQKLHYVSALDPDGDSWGTDSVVYVADGFDETTAISRPAMAEISGKPAAAYVTYDSWNLENHGTLKYRRAFFADGSAWREQDVIMPFGVDTRGTLRMLEIEGRPYIVYFTALGELRFAYGDDPDGTSWSGGTIYNGAVTNQYELAIIGGIPCIYFDEVSCLFFQALNPQGTAWGPPEQVWIDSPSSKSGSLADVGGRPAIALHYGRSLCFCLRE